MNFDVWRTGNFIEIKTGFRETVECVECAPLQQLSERAFKRNLETRMRAETRETPLIARIEQRDIHHRILTAERGILDQDAETGAAQSIDSRCEARVAGDDFVRNFGQTKPLADNAELDVAFDDFGERLRLRFCGRIAGGEAVADVKIGEDESDPVLYITDLLIHLSAKQLQKTAAVQNHILKGKK